MGAAARISRRGSRWPSSGASLAADDRIPRTLVHRGTRVYVDGDERYPIGDDVPQRPPVLLAEGDVPDVFDRPRVAVVGTRAATPHGLADAREIGAVLGAAGITVVSGLAIGIDAAAHEGALDVGGPVVGVVATGLDIVYPRRHRVLFDRVRRGGLLVSELGYGVQPRREQFPIRNRIIAGLADVVVVVEATVRGGARITAERAVEYNRQVLAMPGSRRNPSAAGTNALIADGAHPLLEPADVLVALGLTAASRRAARNRPVSGDTGAVLRGVRRRGRDPRSAREPHAAQPVGGRGRGASAGTRGLARTGAGPVVATRRMSVSARPRAPGRGWATARVVACRSPSRWAVTRTAGK